MSAPGDRIAAAAVYRGVPHRAPWWLGLVTAACTSSPPPPPVATVAAPPVTESPVPTPTEPAEPDDTASFEAIVRIDAAPSGKRLQAVWLERDDGARWIVAYRPEPWLRAFEGERVRVAGQRYTPQGQAVLAPHLRIDTLQVVDDTRAPLASAGPERAMTGHFVAEVVEPGAKGEGERYLMFVSDGGGAYQLANHPEGVEPGRAVTIRAREVSYSKFVAHRGGPMIWVLELDGRAVEPAADRVKAAPSR